MALRHQEVRQIRAEPIFANFFHFSLHFGYFNIYFYFGIQILKLRDTIFSHKLYDSLSGFHSKTGTETQICVVNSEKKSWYLDHYSGFLRFSYFSLRDITSVWPLMSPQEYHLPGKWQYDIYFASRTHVWSKMRVFDAKLYAKITWLANSLLSFSMS